MKIPLSEHFHSIQGEGFWTGTPMHFLRLPGCSVGRSMEKAGEPRPPILPTNKFAWQCRTWDDRPFWCDTDFNKYEEVELDELLAETWEEHICVTGGEPLIHKEIVQTFVDTAYKIHIETSGTIEYTHSSAWITVSPKYNCLDAMLERANEIKLLIGKRPYGIPWIVLDSKPLVYLSPINDVPNVPGQPLGDPNNLRICMDLLRQHPNWKLSVQLHKYLGLR